MYEMRSALRYIVGKNKNKHLYYYYYLLFHDLLIPSYLVNDLP